MTHYKGTAKEKREAVEMIKNWGVYKSGDQFRLTDVVRYLGSTRFKWLKQHTVRHYLEEMKKEGAVSSVMTGNTLKYSRARPKFRYDKIPWRKHTNEQLDIYPTRLGSY